MTTWITHPELWLTALLGIVLLISATVSQAATVRGEEVTVRHATEMPILEETTIVAAPLGYCIDPLASVSTRRAAFVLMASCRSLAEDPRSTAPDFSGLLTASVDGREDGVPSHRALNSFFVSEQGRAALSRSGDANSMELGAMYSHRGVFYLKAVEAGDHPAFGAASWRAVFDLKGRMVTATLRELTGQPIADADGFLIVRQLVTAILEANPDRRDTLADSFSMQ